MAPWTQVVEPTLGRRAEKKQKTMILSIPVLLPFWVHRPRPLGSNFGSCLYVWPAPIGFQFCLLFGFLDTPLWVPILVACFAPGLPPLGSNFAVFFGSCSGYGSLAPLRRLKEKPDFRTQNRNQKRRQNWNRGGADQAQKT